MQKEECFRDLVGYDDVIITELYRTVEIFKSKSTVEAKVHNCSDNTTVSWDH